MCVLQWSVCSLGLSDNEFSTVTRDCCTAVFYLARIVSKLPKVHEKNVNLPVHFFIVLSIVTYIHFLSSPRIHTM